MSQAPVMYGNFEYEPRDTDAAIARVFPEEAFLNEFDTKFALHGLVRAYESSVVDHIEPKPDTAVFLGHQAAGPLLYIRFQN